MSPSFIIVGAGRVGLSLAASLSADEDSRVIVVGRSKTPPAFLREVPGAAYVAGSTPEASLIRQLAERLDTGAGSPILVFCVPDDVLLPVAEGWSDRLEVTPRAVLHTSGVHPAGVLHAWEVRGVPVAAWHPLVAVASPRREAFRAVWFGVDGDPEAVHVAEELAARLGGRAHAIRPDGRSHYHVAGVFASNFLVACLSVALSEMRLASDEATLETLLPLAESALRNLRELGLLEGVTGPVVRGDVRTVTAHLEALAPERAAVYRGLGLELLELLGDQIDPATHARLAAELSASGRQEVNRRPKDD